MTFCYMPHVISCDFKLSSSSLSDSLVLAATGVSLHSLPLGRALPSSSEPLLLNISCQLFSWVKNGQRQ